MPSIRHGRDSLGSAGKQLHPKGAHQRHCSVHQAGREAQHGARLAASPTRALVEQYLFLKQDWASPARDLTGEDQIERLHSLRM